MFVYFFCSDTVISKFLYRNVLKVFSICADSYGLSLGEHRLIGFNTTDSDATAVSCNWCQKVIRNLTLIEMAWTIFEKKKHHSDK